MRKSLFRPLLLLILFAALAIALPAAAEDLSALSCAIVATNGLELRPLELNQRDPVSVLDLVYEGLFTMDDNYAPQPELAYSYNFSNEGRKLIVELRQDVKFHNGNPMTSRDVVATLDYM